MELCSCFQRFEQKYLLDTDTYQKLRLELTPYMESDQYGISHISSIYFDTNESPGCSQPSRKNRPK